MLLHIKNISEKILFPLALKIKRIPANVITGIGLLCAVISFIGFVFNYIEVIIVFIFFTEFFDQLDGVVARVQGPTTLGAFLDSTLDRIGDFFIYFGLILGGYTNLEIGVIALVGAFLTSYTRSKIEGLGIMNLYGVGLLERTDRVPILFIGAILEIWFSSALWWTSIVLAVGSMITVIQRIIFAFKNFKKRD